jgi:glycosyltransferase involved in cell wall biosynthesis
LKILLSAFVCEPNAGSEPNVGWNWAVFLARAGHQVVVLTRSRSRAAIEEVAKSALPEPTPRFEYFDVARPLRWETRGPLHLHNALWQWQAAAFAKHLHQREQFDCVHHVTFAGLRAPSFMGKLGIPFILGPVGGGERAPWILRRGYSLKGLLSDGARDVANLLTQFIPFMVDTFASAERIYVTSPQTLLLMPRRYRDKAQVELAIGAEEPAPIGQAVLPPQTTQNSGLRVLYAGRFIDCKGMHIGLPAFARLIDADPDAQLTMVGQGSAEQRWRKLADKLGISASIRWLPWQDREAMERLYGGHHVLLCPAMHDSGGMVILEAMNQGLPVVCLKLGGPATLVNESCGYAVDPAGRDVAEVVRAMGDALIALVRESTRHPLSQAARMRYRDFSWQEKVDRIYGLAS